jgi:hypothetical protein
VKRSEYARRLHWVGIATLVVLTAALVFVGWELRPSAGGFPHVPSGIEIEMQTPTIHRITESLTATRGGGATLKLVDTTDAVGRWTIQLVGVPPANVCPRSSYETGLGSAGAVAEGLVVHERVFVPHLVSVGGPIVSAEVTGSGFFYVLLCWSSHAPIATNGAYLNAVLPPIHNYGQPGVLQVDRQLNLGTSTSDPDTSAYTVQSLVQPDSVTPGGWQWHPRVPASLALTLSAVNSNETQKDSYRAFLSGILFGVAGGALVALIQEFVAPFRARAELRPPEPGG